MKPTKWHKILSLTMVLPVVLASLSVTINKHYCGTNLVDISVVSKVESCCKIKIPVEDDTLKFSENRCCSNVSLFVEGFDNYPTITTTSDISTSVISVVMLSFYNSLELRLNSQLAPFNSTYRPPPLIVDVQVRNQVFLI